VWKKWGMTGRVGPGGWPSGPTRPVIPHFFHTAVANFSAAARNGFPVGLAGFGVPPGELVVVVVVVVVVFSEITI